MLIVRLGSQEQVAPKLAQPEPITGRQNQTSPPRPLLLVAL